VAGEGKKQQQQQQKRLESLEGQDCVKRFDKT
jgi:hypothetical protein